MHSKRLFLNDPTNGGMWNRDVVAGQSLWVALTLLVSSLLASAQSNVPVNIERAVGLTWLSQADRQYQVESSPDLKLWSAEGPILRGRSEQQTAFLPAVSPHTFYRVREISGIPQVWFPGLQELQTGSADVTAAGSTLDFTNLRLKADGIAFDDSVSAQFVFDPTNQTFRLNRYSVAQGVGVATGHYFAKDNPAALTFQSGATTLLEDNNYNVQIPAAGLKIHARLSTGRAVVLWFDDISAPVYQVVTRPERPETETILPKSSAAIYSEPIAASVEGDYQIELRPVDGTPATCRMSFHDANRNTLQTAGNGKYISVALTKLFEYHKFRVVLTADQVLSVSKPADNSIRLTLIDDRSAKAGTFTGLPLNFRAPRDGSYYLFIDHQRGNTDSGYNGTVSISD